MVVSLAPFWMESFHLLKFSHGLQRAAKRSADRPQFDPAVRTLLAAFDVDLGIFASLTQTISNSHIHHAQGKL